MFDMERRGFLRAGAAALGVVGVSSAVKYASAATTTTVSATTAAGPSIFSFGAVGDGVTDDSAAFSAALQAAATQGIMVFVPPATYAIHNTIKWTSSGVVTSVWGLDCRGATLKSNITNGGDVINLTSNNTVRYFRLTGGLTINGNGSEGNGLHIFCPTESYFFYNFLIDGLAVQGVGGDGLLIEGDVFEGTVANSYFEDCKNGAVFADSQGGVCSAINVIGCFFSQNSNYGLWCTNFDGQYGGCMDVRVYGGYCRQNGSYGFYYNNGTSPGAAIENVGFENNCMNLQPGNTSGGHIYALVSMNLRNCTGYAQMGGASALLQGWFSGLTTIDNCVAWDGGAVTSAGATRLVYVNGSNTGHVVVNNSQGGVAFAGGQCTWVANYCTGTSPLGPLNMRGSVGVV